MAAESSDDDISGSTRPPSGPSDPRNRYEKYRDWRDCVRLIVQTLTLICAVAGLLKVAHETKGLSTEVKHVGRRLEASSFIITKPQADETVALDVGIYGQTPFVGMHHYIVVTAGTGDAFVQPREATVSQAGTFEGKAQLGEAGAGGGEAFTLRVLATKDALPEGPLTRVPDDALFSSSVTVMRNP